MDFDSIMQKPVKGYGNSYIIHGDGRVWSRKTKRWRKTEQNENGYSTILLQNRGRRKLYAVHRLVAQAFLPNPESKRCVNHKNGIRTDNRVDNLEWCTHAENTQDSIRRGSFKDNRGEKNPKSKLTDVDVLRIRQIAKPGLFGQLAREYSVHPTTISGIFSGKYWRHI